MIIRIYYVYPLVHAGEVSVGVAVEAIISGTITIAVVLVTLLAVAVVLLAVIALRQNAKKRGTIDIESTVSVDKYSMQILVYCAVFLCCMALVYSKFTRLIAVLSWYNFVGKKWMNGFCIAKKLAEVY